MVYEHITSANTSSGSTSSTTLKILGGTLGYLLVRANTDTTVFRVNLQDDNGNTRLNYAFHTGELVDEKIQMPLSGEYTINITNASPDDIFKIILSIKE